jgi:hypothetical protein
MQKLLHDPAGLGRGFPILGVASGVFTHGDPVYIDSNGFLNVASNSSGILGYYVGPGETLLSTNATVDKICPDWVPARDIVMSFPALRAITQTDLGTTADFSTYTTGAYVVDPDTASDDTVYIVGFDPDDTDQVFVIAANVHPQGNASS